MYLKYEVSVTVTFENKKKIQGTLLTDKRQLICHDCKEKLSPQPGESYLILRKETRRGQPATTHYYLCKQCLKQKIIPRCEEKNCKCRTCQDPDTRLKNMNYDSERGGETSCLKCGIVFEEGLLGRGTLGENKSIIHPKEPKDYNPTVQQLANDPGVNWFNYTENCLRITCKSGDRSNLLDKYPGAKFIII
jgi:hypothetical protein